MSRGRGRRRGQKRENIRWIVQTYSVVSFWHAQFVLAVTSADVHHEGHGKKTSWPPELHTHFNRELMPSVPLMDSQVKCGGLPWETSSCEMFHPEELDTTHTHTHRLVH